jgi:hypothetical protein
MRIINIDGTSDNTCGCGSWLDHWLNFSGQSLPRYCPETSCTNKPEVGAHVQKNSNSDKNWYIVPLCKGCNGKRSESLEISDSICSCISKYQRNLRLILCLPSHLV